MAVTAAAAIVGAGVGLYKIWQGAKAKKEAKANAARLTQPAYQVQNEYFQNRNLTEANATQGYTGATKDYLTSENQQGLGTGISAIESSGGNPNDIAKLYGAYLHSTNQTAAQDSQLQLKNIEDFRQANTAVAGQRTIGWSLNEDRPYQTKRKEYRQDAAIADANMMEGANTFVGSLSAYGAARTNAKNANPVTPYSPPSSNYFAQQPVDTISSQQPMTQTIQPRQSPNISVNQPGQFSGGGGYYPQSDDMNWGNALGLNYN